MRQDPESLMVFAAGFGKRMSPLTDDKPKPLIDVGGISLLDHALACRTGMNITTTVVNAHYKASMIEAAVAAQDVVLSVENPDILDTGGGLVAALPHLRGQNVFTLNADMVWLGPNPLDVLRKAWQTTRAEALALVVPLTSAHNRTAPGDFALSSDGQITRMGEYVYTGAQILDTRHLEEIDKTAFSLNEIWDILIESRRMEGVIYPGEWCDVGTPAGLALANTLWAKFVEG